MSRKGGSSAISWEFVRSPLCVLRSFDFNTGLAEADVETARLVRELVTSESIRGSCPAPYDEALLWKAS